MIELRNIDCLEYMATVPDKYFDLAIVDPPYDFSIGNKTNIYISQGAYNKKQRTRPAGGFKIGGNYMDSLQKAPSIEYFIELQRVSKNQIIFGGNYYTHILKQTTCWIVWDKLNGENYFGDFEMAWTSFGSANRMYKRIVHEEDRIHPTQKPIALYKWLLKNYAKPDMKIFDSHGGSMSSVIACYDFGISEMVCCEIDKEYFDSAVARVLNHVRQLSIFDNKQEIFVNGVKAL